MWRKNKKLWRSYSRTKELEHEAFLAEIKEEVKKEMLNEKSAENYRKENYSTTHIEPQFKSYKKHTDAEWIKAGGWSGKR